MKAIGFLCLLLASTTAEGRRVKDYKVQDNVLDLSDFGMGKFDA